MSSFFTVPGAQKKRKRLSGPDAPKKRVAPTNSSRSKLGKPSSSRGGPPLKKNSSSGSSSSSKKAGGKAAKDDEDDESISGSDSDDLDDARQQDGSDDDNGESSSEDGRVTEGQDEEETAAERRLRLAERYLENIKEHVDEAGFDAADIDRDLIAERLQEDMAESKGRVYRQLASSLALDRASRTFFRSNSRAVTSISTCGPYVYTASKDMCLHKWRTQDLPQDQFPQTTRRKPAGPDAPARRRPTLETWVKGDRGKARDRGYKRHVGPILAVAASPDGQYVVTGGEDRRLIVWDAATLRPLKVLSQHRDAVTGLAFRRGTNQLYSCSRDRTVKVWSLDEMAYVETLFGHQDHVVDIDALAQERCVSVGARDRTARLWKVAEETQLVFRGGSTTAPKASAHPAVAAVADPRSLLGEGSMDRIAMIDDDLFVTGGDNGSLALWSVQKKKPVYIEPLAHGLDPALRPEQASADKNPKPDVVPAPTPRWVTAIRAIPYSDVFFTGSWDGYVRVWRLSDDKRKIESLGVLSSSKHHDVKDKDEDGDDDDDDEKKKKKKKKRKDKGEEEEEEKEKPIIGVVNGISVFERGERAANGICVVAAVSSEHRLGRWRTWKKARNGGVIFEVPRSRELSDDGSEHGDEDEGDDDDDEEEEE